MRVDIGEIDEAIGGADPMIGRDVQLQVELIEKRLLDFMPAATMRLQRYRRIATTTASNFDPKRTSQSLSGK